MDRKGIILNSAFFISGAFVLAGHLVFTFSYNPDYVLSVIVGKLTAGIMVALLALVVKQMSFTVYEVLYCVRKKKRCQFKFIRMSIL